MCKLDRRKENTQVRKFVVKLQRLPFRVDNDKKTAFRFDVKLEEVGALSRFAASSDIKN